MKNKQYKWIYKIINKNNPSIIYENEIVTNLPALKLCAWFESIGYEIVYLNRICEMYAEVVNKVPYKNTYASVIVYKEKKENEEL